MRKWPALLAALMLTGCAAVPAEPARPPEQFEAAGRLRCKGLEAQVTLRRDGRDQLEFESPAGLRGLRVTVDPGYLILDFDGLERRFTRGSLPEGSAAGLLLSALDAAAENGVREDGSCDASWGSFTLSMKPDGNILKLSIPERDLELEVQNFKNLSQSG